LSDEGLHEIERGDLTDIARAAYDAELGARGLQIENAAPVADNAPEPSLEDMGWVPLATFNAEEIELVRALLEAEEIPSDMDLRSSANYPPQAEGSILYVPERSLARAREVLASQISEEELIAEAEAGEPPEDV
jgi:hypothetical protein